MQVARRFRPRGLERLGRVRLRPVSSVPGVLATAGAAATVNWGGYVSFFPSQPLRSRRRGSFYAPAVQDAPAGRSGASSSYASAHCLPAHALGRQFA